MRRFVLGLAVAAAIVGGPGWTRAGETETAAQAANVQKATQIANNLKSSGALSGFRIGVRFRDGVAVLRGTVANEQQKAAALAIAEQSEGVTQVVDQLAIGQQPPPAAGPVQHAAFAGGPPDVGQGLQAQVARAMPRPFAVSQSLPGRTVAYAQGGGPAPAYMPGVGGNVQPARYDQPNLPPRAWPTYAAYPNYGAVTYPKQYSPTAWPYIGPFYPYPQVPLGWRKVTLEWDDGWWMLDFKARRH
jgi:hypothetical protein